MAGPEPLRNFFDKMNSKKSKAKENGANAGGGDKRLSVERIYKKKSQLEHILLRPDTYIGSVEPVTESMWVYDEDGSGMVQREITYVPGLYKIFDEILVNAADNKQRDPKMDTIKVDIDRENNVISIFNNGKGIPVVMHRDENMFVPTMIFGHLLTSSNYDDDEEKVTGGRNGYGAKLCNIFSSMFTVETASREEKKCFKQVWRDNMSNTSDPVIKSFSGEDYTKITFSSDLAKFKMNSLDADSVALLSRRAFDIAASSRGVKVFLNGKRLPIKGFKDYIDLYLKPQDEESEISTKPIYESVNERWEIAVALSEKGFQQVSFVNSIATTKGGRHVDYVTDLVVKQLLESLKKKNKNGAVIKPHAVKNHMWVFVNCLIVNPTFDSQTKEHMTLQAKSFGSKCQPSDKFFQAIVKSGIVEHVMQWATFKAQSALNKQCNTKKQNKLRGIPKLEDANDAGTRNSLSCTLILTEGDSAKTLAVSGLGVVGRDKYGVFPLRGKLLNVREATHKQILENAEINSIIKIVGLQYKKKYQNMDDMKTLRYGKLMIMTDQDQDGSHIKGLLINFFHHNWPSLLRQDFLEEFITPIVKSTKANVEIPFYSIPEFEEWKAATNNWHTYRIKYYKGLGTSTSKEAKEYFRDMQRHRITFDHNGDRDDFSITMAFSKKHVEERKVWLTTWMEDCKRRKELGLADVYLYEKNTKSVTYENFVNKELVLFSNLDNERSIPCLVDGLKPGQRKVIFTCIKRKLVRELKVAQLAGSVAEISAYHHGEASLMSTIINLAHNFVGSNNINLLMPIGQFGTRLQGGKDAASPRYIFTKLSELTRMLFHPNDDALLHYLKDDNQKIEPDWYIPIIPMVLVNGADGIGTGWMTKIPNFNPRDIVENIRRIMAGEEPLPMLPWYKNFRGSVEALGFQRYIVSGEMCILNSGGLEINELPVGTWTQNYKEGVIEPLLSGSEKTPSIISDYKEYHTDTTVRFVVSLTDDNLSEAQRQGLHKVFKLQSSITTTSMVLFDQNGCLKRYDSAEEILKDFYKLRFTYYVKRKKYMEGVLQAEACKLSNQARFILEKCDGRVVVENKKRKAMIAELKDKNYDPDPVRMWQKANDKENLEEEQAENAQESEEETMDQRAPFEETGSDYDYLLGMAMWNLTQEKKEELLKKRDNKIGEYERLLKKTPTNLWEDDLDAFLAKLDEIEEKERKEELVPKAKGVKGKVPPKQGKIQLKNEVMPSPCGRRVEPLIDNETKAKFEKLTINKEKKKLKKTEGDEPVVKDEFDEMAGKKRKSLSDRVGSSPDDTTVKPKRTNKTKVDGLKQTKLVFKSAPKKSPDVVDDDVESDRFDAEVLPLRERVAQRAAAAKATFKVQGSDEESDEVVISDSDSDFGPSSPVKGKIPTKGKTTAKSAPAKARAPAAKKAAAASTAGDEDSDMELFKKQPAKPAEDRNALFDSLLSSPDAARTTAKPAAALESPDVVISDDDDVPPPKKAPAKKNGEKAAASKAKRAPARTKVLVLSDSEDEPSPPKRSKVALSDDEEFVPTKRGSGGRSRKPVSYAVTSESDSD